MARFLVGAASSREKKLCDSQHRIITAGATLTI